MGRHSNLLKLATEHAKFKSRPDTSNPSQAKRSKTETKYRFKSDRSNVKNIKLNFPTKKKYSCQLSLSIILYARSIDTLRVIRHDDTLRSIEAEHHESSISFFDLFSDGDFRTIPTGHLDKLEERFVAALSALHTNRIFYPISAKHVGFLQSSRDSAEPQLYLQYNSKARWASNKLPKTWQADQLSHARCLFRVVKMLLRLSTCWPGEHIAFNIQEQRDLETYVRKLGPPSHHVDLLVNSAAPMTTRLASEVMLYLVKKARAEEGYIENACDFFDSLFGKCVPLLGSIATPSVICEIYHQLRLRQYKTKIHEYDQAINKDLGDAVVRSSPPTVATFICCRAEIASLLGDDDKDKWWLMAKNFTSSYSPREE
ncbi:hypothetical protein Hte_000085 [Hypoxylon texense]